MDLRETYNKIAEEWHRSHQADDWWVKGTDTFIAFLKPKDLVLDAGCAASTKSAYLIKKGLRVMGIDFSNKLIEIAKCEVPQGEFQVLDMREVQSMPQKFDGIFAQASLLHIPKKEVGAVLAGFAAKLKPHGLLYIAVKGMRDGGPEEEVKEESDYGYPYQRFFSYYTMDELKAHFAALGLKVVHEDTKRTGKSDWLQLIGRRQ